MEEPTITESSPVEAGEVSQDPQGNEPLEGSDSAQPQGEPAEKPVSSGSGDDDQSAKLRREYTQSRQEISELRSTAEQQSKMIEELQAQIRGEVAPDPMQDAVKQLDPYLREMGYMTETEFESRNNAVRARQELQSEIGRLEETYTGEDGRPKFDAQKVAEFVLEKSGTSNLLPSDLEVAYKQMHEQQLIDWHIKKSQERKAGTYSEKSDSSGQTQAQPSDSEMLQRANRSGDYSAIVKRKLGFNK